MGFRVSGARSADTCPVLLDDLTALLGADRVQTGDDVRRQHGMDESFHAPAPPDAVVFPRTNEECVGVVRACRAHRTPIIPFGAGTSLEGHVMALRGGISVDMRELNRILRLSIDDLDVTVQAGVTRRQLEDRLLPEGVFFPVDPGSDATIGGMVATGATGTMTVRYGGMRENVLSLLVVTPDGELVRTRSRARKSAAGYDLTRLMIGSEGTLGLVCEATLRLQPTPEAMSAAVAVFPSLRDAVQCVIAAIQEGIRVARIELVDALQVEATNRYAQLDMTVAPTLFLEFHGGPEEVVTQAADLERVAHEHGVLDWRFAASEGERRTLWRARHDAYHAAKSLRPGCTVLTTDACVPVSALAEVLLATRADLDANALVATILGHVGDGNFHVTVLLDPDDPAELDRAMAFHDRLVRRAIEHEGTCTGEHGVGYGKSAYLELEHGAGGVELMRAIKRALDPEDLFNPGKLMPPAL
jgi:D-lactate dehydrogenase (cytochrome)